MLADGSSVPEPATQREGSASIPTRASEFAQRPEGRPRWNRDRVGASEARHVETASPAPS